MTLAISRAEAMFKSGQADVPLQLLVVAPSQELAMQIVRVSQGLLPDEHRRMVQQCIGGANPKYQMDALLMNKPLIVVGTPGRVAEFIRLGALKLHRCGYGSQPSCVPPPSERPAFDHKTDTALSPNSHSRACVHTLSRSFTPSHCRHALGAPSWSWTRQTSCSPRTSPRT